MSSSGLQAAFAHVLVDRKLRDRLSEQGEALRARFDLTGEELEKLLELSPSRLGVTATTVGAKRVDFLVRALPRTSTIFGGSCQCQLMGFVEASMPFEPSDGNQVNRLVAEGQRFIEYLETRPAGAPTYAVDLANYELLHLKLNYASDAVRPPEGEVVIAGDAPLQLGRHVALGEFGHDVVSLIEAPELPKAAAPAHAFVALVKSAPRKIVPYRIGPAVFRMLESWRAPATLSEVRAALSAQLGPSVEPGVDAAARFALQEGILVTVAKD
ncbi:hypothetical protein [Sorangium cellulosum]|uniref:DNA-binding domain-containing protein n=1 Tax=Sorangium cellulosum TaxID=56 RepID=A0A2L0EHY9_SORCE|nr:hypothetical protein [Sorangium cellulosum]AUX38912.1 uncharacterized protein SOCE26_002930 [Sorangium cellulosum]